ncbi:hypothetical protein GT037_001736 [Alternaria burnsii]|uniref:Uncharacterized protein n=1 Tax=Alternaria burnsii TaxID=1187904 RepID=A0A8H7EHF0_9PLEO|nr:uncharacterized protein GT037_001736 [Alternaria burnsii]KAF7680085.1 hypothetical protein GT037_001736 [Alternaria burnsii]
MPTSLSDVSYLTEVSDGHDGAEKVNVTLQLPSSFNTIPGARIGELERNIDQDVSTQAVTTLNARVPDNATHDQQTSADDRITTFADNISFKVTCNMGQEAVLSMDNMWLNVGTVMLDLEKGIYQMSTDWGEEIPSDDDIIVWMHVDIFDPNPKLVHTTLIRNMFQLIVFNSKCNGRRYTKGGSVLAMRAGQRSMKLANVSIYAINRRDVKRKVGGRL